MLFPKLLDNLNFSVRRVLKRKGFTRLVWIHWDRDGEGPVTVTGAAATARCRLRRLPAGGEANSIDETRFRYIERTGAELRPDRPRGAR